MDPCRRALSATGQHHSLTTHETPRLSNLTCAFRSAILSTTQRSLAPCRHAGAFLLAVRSRACHPSVILKTGDVIVKRSNVNQTNPAHLLPLAQADAANF